LIAGLLPLTAVTARRRTGVALPNRIVGRLRSRWRRLRLGGEVATRGKSDAG